MMLMLREVIPMIVKSTRISIVEMSTKEVEEIFEAKSVGKSMKEFKRCFAIFFDEFKAVKSEIKQLQFR